MNIYKRKERKENKKKQEKYERKVTRAMSQECSGTLEILRQRRQKLDDD